MPNAVMLIAMLRRYTYMKCILQSKSYETFPIDSLYTEWRVRVQYFYLYFSYIHIHIAMLLI